MTPPPKDRILPLIALCTILFASLLISESRADIQGIPDSYVFQRAEYPYARVLESCTTWRRPDNVADTWGTVSFRGACQQHDKCYHSKGSTWSSCNRQFLIDLRGACDRDLKAEILATTGHGEPKAEQIQLCYEIANLFHGQVQKTEVREHYRFAQQVQAQYHEHVGTELSLLFAKTLGRSPTTSELANAFESLDSGMSFADIERSIASEETAVQDDGQASLESETVDPDFQTVTMPITSN